MANYNFEKDIQVGESGEKVVIEYLTSKGATLITDNKDRRYDIAMSRKGKTIYYEIKTDVYCSPTRDTGNMFVEFQSRGKDSGIMVTQADWFVTYYPKLKQIWFIKTAKLKQLINENNFRHTANSGDSSSFTRGFLIKRDTYKENFIVKYVETKDTDRTNP